MFVKINRAIVPGLVDLGTIWINVSTIKYMQESDSFPESYEVHVWNQFERTIREPIIIDTSDFYKILKAANEK